MQLHNWRYSFLLLVLVTADVVVAGREVSLTLYPRCDAPGTRWPMTFGVPLPKGKRYYLITRVWGPDGTLRDLQYQPPKEHLHEIQFGPEEAGRLWLHTRGFGPNACMEFSGDIVPVISFTRESFFIPQALAEEKAKQ